MYRNMTSIKNVVYIKSWILRNVCRLQVVKVSDGASHTCLLAEISKYLANSPWKSPSMNKLNSHYIIMTGISPLWKCEDHKVQSSKLLRGKTFTIREENGFLWENFCNSMLVYLCCQLTQPWSHSKTFMVGRTTAKTAKVSPLKVLPYMVSVWSWSTP